jgi:hypothetical protein
MLQELATWERITADHFILKSSSEISGENPASCDLIRIDVLIDQPVDRICQSEFHSGSRPCRKRKTIVAGGCKHGPHPAALRRLGSEGGRCWRELCRYPPTSSVLGKLADEAG